jgi:iron complex outermembrane receptor protein
MCTGFFRHLAVALVAAATLSIPLQAQQGTLSGRVTDASTQAPLAGVEVFVGDAATQTTGSGGFTVSVSAGSVSVTVRALGYRTMTQEVTVGAGETVTLQFTLEPDPFLLDAITVTPGRTTARRDPAPQTNDVSFVTQERIEVQASTTAIDYVKDVRGLDMAQSGITQSNVVTRGFNNVFSGSLLVLSDNRYARVPSLRLNAYNMIPATPLDVERIEVVLGPASALYGPNSANGIMHIITTSPIDRPGTSVSVTGGNRSIFSGAFRQAFRFSEKVGLKASGQYFRGDDFVYRDPAEVPSGSNPLIANRIFDAERYGGEARLDLRPWEGSNDGVSFTYGVNQLVNSIELTGIGAGQAKDWRYQFGQVQVRRAGLFAQAFLNTSDAGDTYLLRTGQSIVDNSTMLAAQAQYAFTPLDGLDLIAGADYSKTTPKTEGTITGSNENSDETTELGGYLSATFALTEMLDLVGALRVDDHEHLENQVWSPRAGLVFEPVEGQSFRAAYNRAFSTPTTNNLFLDIVAGRIPVGPVGYDLRTLGVSSTGFTWTNQCAGGVSSYCMYSPFAPGTELPATGTVLWDGVVVPTLLSNPDVQAGLAAMGITPAEWAAMVATPTPADMASVLRRFNHETLSFGADPGPTALEPIKPTITTTFEVGYDGFIGDVVRLSTSIYRSQIKDFVGPLRVETPTVLLDGTSVASFVATRMADNGVPAANAAAFAGSVAPGAAMIPLGTVVPDQRTNSDMILTYRNFGDVNLWGADVGVEVAATPELFLTGTYSWASEECFDFNDDGSCASSADIALNAPTNKGTVGFRFDDRSSGVVFGARARYSDGFPMNSGVYVGDVESYTVVDANVAYRVPQIPGFIASLTVNNVLDNKHREFIGAPEIGMIALVKLQYEFGGR